MTGRRKTRVLHHSVVYASGIVLCVFSIVPLLWGLSTSLKSDAATYAFPPQWIPAHPTLSNFVSVLGNGELLRNFANSALISVATTAIALVIGVLGAYGFSRFRFRGRNGLLWSVLFTQLFPRVAIIVPFFVTLRRLSLINTYQGLILVYLVAVFPVAIWMIKGFFDRIPADIEEAAAMDGCSVFRLLWQIVLPMARPALVAVAMYSFILAWNEFLFALVFTNGPAKRPIAVGLAFFIDDVGIHWGQLMAASLLMSIPAIIIFCLSQKLLIRGLSEGAVK